jgi:uncharacterized protein HemX
MQTDTPNRAPDEKSFINRLIDQTPNWALGAVGALLTLALTLKIIGVDVAGPTNQIVSAYVKAIEAQTAGMLKFEEATKVMEGLIAQQRESLDNLNARVGDLGSTLDSVVEQLANHEKRIVTLESVVQHPNGDKLK